MSSYDELVESLYDLTKPELRRLSEEAMLIVADEMLTEDLKGWLKLEVSFVMKAATINSALTMDTIAAEIKMVMQQTFKHVRFPKGAFHITVENGDNDEW